MRSDQKKLHLMERFLISLISVYYFVYKRKKAGNLKCLISLIFKSVKISIKKLIRMQKLLYTHGCRNVTISALAYLINYLDCQRSGRVMGGPTFFKVGDLFYKICPSHYANFRKKISSETSCGMSETLGIT